MTCSSCSGAVEVALRAVPGVQAASVSLLSGVAEVRAWGGLCARLYKGGEGAPRLSAGNRVM